MARADIGAATHDIGELHAMPFGGKRMGRFVLTRDQVASLLRVEIAQDKTIRKLSITVLNEKGLVLTQSGKSLYSVVAARKATRWRKVPRNIIADLIGPIVTSEDQVRDDEDGEEGED